MTPDSGAAGAMTPDSGAADAGLPDFARPDAGLADSARPDAVERIFDTAGPLRPVDASTVDAGIWRGEIGLSSPVDAGDSATWRPPVGAAILTVTPPSVDLGVVDLGTTSVPVTVTVSNAGTTTSGSLGVIVTGVGIFVSGCSGVVLAPKDTCQISISARPSVPGPISGVVEVGDRPETSKKISVSGISTGGSGSWTLSPNPLDLGAVLVGKTVTGTIVLTNTSTTGLPGIVINVSGVGFTLSPTGNCTDALPVGQVCNIVVSFTAGSAAGIAKGSVTVSQGGVSRIVAVTANVQTPARLVMTPTTATLVTVVGTPSSAATFYVTNAGDVSSAIPTVTITGTDHDDFSFETSCNRSLPGGATASCQITVVYTPQTAPAGNASARLTVAEPGTGGSSVFATLSGTAVIASPLRLTGASTDLGTVLVGDQGTPATFTLSNGGGESSGVVKLVSSAPQFAIDTDNCAGKDLAPGQECTFTIRFIPATGDVGVFQAQIRATGAETANPTSLGITAIAVPAAKLAINPAALDFGTVPVSQESAPLTLTVSNTGGVPTEALQVQKIGAQFTIKGDTCSGGYLSAIGTSTTCRIVVTFTPTSAADATGAVTVSTENTSTITASLRGTGG